MMYKVGLADDHQLFLKSLKMLIESFKNFEVCVEALNGQELQQKLNGSRDVPDVMLIDVNMPVMDGISTAQWLNQKFPAMHLVALSMNNKDDSILKMIRAGCCSYLLKDTHPNELEKALNEIVKKGYYNADATNVNLRRLLSAEEKPAYKISTRELEFLQHACTDMTYKQIAGIMNLSERTIDGYRESLFMKLDVQSRVGLCMEALRQNLVKL